MAHRHRSLLAVLPFAALLLVAAAQEPSGQFSESTTVLEVRVPVEVVANGEPVRGLTRANFEIYEGRRQQKITGFDVIDLHDVKTATPSPTVLPPAARRHFLLLFDLTFAEPTSVLRAREAAMKLVHNQFNPSDLVAVATYSLNRGPHLVLNFTTDRLQVDEAIRTLDLPKLATEPQDPLRLMLQSEQPEQILGSGSGLTTGPGGGMHAMGQAMFVEQLKDMMRQSGKANLQTQSNEAIAFSQALSDMAKSLSAVKGRKYVVFLSEGFSGDVLTGGKVSQETHQNIEQGQTWNVDTQQMFGNARVQNDVEKMLDTFRRSDCIIESVDIGGLRAANAERQRPNGDASLFLMAHDTGGELFQHYNDLGNAMKQMLDRTSVIYLLSFAPDDLKPDGSYHRIRVNLVNAPSGARAVTRPGYYAPRPYKAMNTTERQLENAGMIVGGEEGGSLPVSVLAAPFPLRGLDKTAYVPVLIEINGKALLKGVKQADAIAQIYVYAIDPKGGIRDFRVQALRINVKQMGKALESTGLKFFGHLDLSAGQYSIRVLVRNAETGMAAIRVVPVTVPAFDQPKTVILRPLFPEKPGKWLIVREAMRKADQQQVPYPFMAGEQPFIPAGSPEIATSSQLPVYLVGYHLPDGSLDLHAVVTRPDGTEVSGGALKVTGAPEAGGIAAVALPATFDTRGLAPGRYLLRVELKTASGKIESAPAAFSVTGT